MKIVRISAVWCPSCLIMRPRFENIERKYPDIEFKSYDIDLDEEAFNYNAGHILPVFILLDKKNVEIGRLVGEQKEETLIKMIEDQRNTEE
jgi:thiol-disulfide isomerase/thioredoxin